MLAKLELKLKCEKELTYQMSSLFHGALMELLPEEYADYHAYFKPFIHMHSIQKAEMGTGTG